MYKNKHSFVFTLIVELFLLIFQLVLLMRAVYFMQGNGRIVNYAGLVRGATQRLVKNEFYGSHDDFEIEKLDNILLGLQTGQGAYDLTVIRDENYNKKLNILAEEWNHVKSTIYEYLIDHSKAEELYKISEEYFILADEVVDAAEQYSDGIAKQLRILEVTISITIALMLILLGWQTGIEIKRNRMLNNIAYVDPHTGLPNKRSCEDEMASAQAKKGCQNICCLLFDLNDLKYANDTFGHLVGDVLISSFANLLRKYMPASMFVGRFGGDEFIGIQADADENELKKGIELLKKAAGQTNVGTSKQKIIISFAYGYVFSSEFPECSVKELMDIADKRMYENKIIVKKLRC